MASTTNPVATAITTKLTEACAPTHLEVINESSKHNVPTGSETHFKVVCVSTQFDGMKLIERHRFVNDVLAAELSGPVHALSISAKTPQQWETSQVVANSPPCLNR